MKAYVIRSRSISIGEEKGQQKMTHVKIHSKNRCFYVQLRPGPISALFLPLFWDIHDQILNKNLLKG
jgi:hypothetical protein